MSTLDVGFGLGTKEIFSQDRICERGEFSFKIKLVRTFQVFPSIY